MGLFFNAKTPTPEALYAEVLTHLKDTLNQSRVLDVMHMSYHKHSDKEWYEYRYYIKTFLMHFTVNVTHNVIEVRRSGIKKLLEEIPNASTFIELEQTLISRVKKEHDAMLLRDFNPLYVEEKKKEFHRTLDKLINNVESDKEMRVLLREIEDKLAQTKENQQTRNVNEFRFTLQRVKKLYEGEK